MQCGFTGANAADSTVWRSLCDSVEHVEETCRRQGIDQQVKQLGAGPFKAEIASVDLSGTEIFSERYEAGVCLSCSPPENSIGLILTGSTEAQTRICGTDVPGGSLVFLPHAGGLDLVASDRFSSDSLVIPEERFDNIAASIFPDGNFPKKASVVTANLAVIASLRKEIGLLLNQSAPNPERGSELIESTIALLCEVQGGEPASRSDSASDPSTAKQAQEFIEAHFMNKILMEDICLACDVGIRTLQRSFRDYFGLTVTDYIKTTRLNAVFRALKSASPSEATVADTAMRNGFTHLGRFSGLYLERFGESPNSTLRSC